IMNAWVRLTAITEILITLLSVRLPAAYTKAYIAMTTFGIGTGKSAGMMGKATKAVWLLITALSTFNIAGIRAAISMIPLLSMLTKVAKFSGLVVAITIVWNMIQKDKREKAWFFAKKGMLGSALSEAIFGTDFGMSKWFA